MSTQDNVNAVAVSVARLFGDSRYSDMTIKCDDGVWNVHKAIICSRCEYFEKACDGRFKEASGNVITLVEDLPHIVDALVAYLYTDDYNDEAHKDEDGYAPLIFNQ